MTLLLVFLGPFLGFSAELPQAWHSFTVIAHRANHTRAHENTLTAIEQAIAAGVDYVELDVRRTSDGSYVLMHDGTVDRMTDGHGRVAELTSAQVRALHVRDARRPQIAPDRVPTFKEALEAIRGRINLYLDFKAGDRAVVAQAIRDAGVSRQVLVYDDADAVKEWRRVAPELPLIVSPPQNARTPEQLAAFVSKYSVEVLDGAWREYSRDKVEAAEKAGARVWPDVQSAQENGAYWERATALGFTGMQTDHPEELCAWLQSQGRR